MPRQQSMLPRTLSLTLIALLVTQWACASATPVATPAATLEPVVRTDVVGRPLMGFFPSPPQMTLESVLAHFKHLGEHGDVVLVQNPPDWVSFLAGVEGESQKRTDIVNQITLARQNGLEPIFVADPLNGLNRREFGELPAGWTPSFGNADVRTAFSNYVLWIVRTFEPRFIGLASEINTYADAFPDDYPNYVSLYHELYAQIKAEAPDTQVFVTFQWEDLNNLVGGSNEGRAAQATNWEQVEVFEPDLDLWVISSYPFVAYPDGAALPDDYYTPLLARTDKPLAVAEGGLPSVSKPPIAGSEAGQVDYLNAVHTQLGPRLSFWIYLLLADLDPDSWGQATSQNGLSDRDANTLGYFVSVGLTSADGTPKPALAVWDGFRSSP